MEKSYYRGSYIGMKGSNKSLVTWIVLIRYLNFKDKIFIRGRNCHGHGSSPHEFFLLESNVFKQVGDAPACMACMRIKH